MSRPGAAWLAAVVMVSGSARGDDRPKPVDFDREVRPILSESCFRCHGPDTAKRKASLRLDTKDGAFAAREKEGGPVLVPGKPGESELVARVASDDPDEVMPPPGTTKPLTPSQVETLRRWVAGGAGWSEHWAYRPPARVEPAEPAGPPGFARNVVDRFVLDGLARNGLRPSPEAGRATLIRRLSFDLTGLPPTPDEVAAFEADASPDAYEKVVDRLLASPRYGERMATAWLDLVRFADTTGYHGDNHREISLYRDYVIDAFNADLPFDRFTVEQLAGDLLPAPTDAQRVASGYNLLLMTTREGGAQAKEYEAKYAADRVRNASTVWLGATLGCAECHDHKYDPFTARDFYRFAAFFADLQMPAVGPQDETKLPTPAQAARARELDGEAARLQKVLDTPTPALETAQAAWEVNARPEWTTLRPERATSEGGATLDVLDDGSVRASGANPERDVDTVVVKAGRKRLTALRLEVLPDGKLPSLGPGRASNGNFVLGGFAASVDGRPLAFSNVTATHAQDGWAVAGAADDRAETGWAILPQAGQRNAAVFELKDDLGPGLSEEATVTLTLRFPYGGSHTLGKFRLSGTDAPRPVLAGALPSDAAKALATPAAERTDDHRRALAAYYRSIAPGLQPTRDALAALKKAKAELEATMPTTLVSRSGPPKVTRVLPRGNWLDESGPEVSPSVPAFLAGSFEGSTRLDLARWLVAADNPLTARVFVNRVWALAFGRGLVATPDDLGAQGARPTHPELLDRLAADFAEGGWDVKRLVRLLVTSGAYRQSSRAPEALRQADPENQWLARQGRFRLDAEFVRDNALAVGGLLSARVGGGSARPPQPSGYWSHLNFPKREYEPDRGEGLHRRGLYTYWCRTFLHPSLLAFDAPTREECAARRGRSNTPVQALVLLNDPIYVEAARALAERAARQPLDDLGRLEWLYRTTLSRQPRGGEGPVALDLLNKHRAEYRADPAAARAALAVGDRPVPDDLDPVDLAAWASVARALLNLHETITRN